MILKPFVFLVGVIAFSATAFASESPAYSVVKGDTLSGVSKKVFGHPKYWSRLWALNKPKKLNPNFLAPGTLLAFNSGASSVTPKLLKKSARHPKRGPASEGSTERSMEWKSLPRQSWESYKFTLPVTSDPLGFDKENKIRVRPAKKGFEPTAIPSTQKITMLGRISGSRSESQYLSLGDTVYIEALEKLQIGETYGITEEPEKIKSSQSDRVGYSYLLKGSVKILGFRDHLFVGTLSSVRDFLPRGSFLMPMPPRVPDLTPIPGPSAIQGTLMLDHRFSTFTVAQHKEVFIDRGSSDGIQPGMVFRVYQHVDPGTQEKISRSNFIIDADLLVTQVSEKFSSAWVTHSISPVTEDTGVELLTDVSDLSRQKGFSDGPRDEEKTVSNHPLEEKKDELDELDTPEQLGKPEQKELKQLENWKANSPEKSSPKIQATDELDQLDTPPPTEGSVTPEKAAVIDKPKINVSPEASVPTPSAPVDDLDNLEAPPEASVGGAPQGSENTLPPPPPPPPGAENPGSG